MPVSSLSVVDETPAWRSDWCFIKIVTSSIKQRQGCRQPVWEVGELKMEREGDQTVALLGVTVS